MMNHSQQKLLIWSLFALLWLMMACTSDERIVTPPVTSDATHLPQDNAIADRNEVVVEENVLGVDPFAPPLESEYVDEALGLSLNFPATWYARGQEGFTVVVSSYSLEDEMSVEPDAGETRISIQLIQSEEQLQALLGEQDEMATPETTMQFQNPAPVRVLSHRVQDDGQTVVTILAVGERHFLVNGNGDLSYYNAILESLGPIVGSE